jgi:hypothetical protein
MRNMFFKKLTCSWAKHQTSKKKKRNRYPICGLFVDVIVCFFVFKFFKA